MTERIGELMARLASLASDIPFQRAVDRLLPEIEAVLADGFTFGRLTSELAAAGYTLPGGNPPSPTYLGGAVSRARSKVRQGRAPAPMAIPAPVAPAPKPGSGPAAPGASSARHATGVKPSVTENVQPVPAADEPPSRPSLKNLLPADDPERGPGKWEAIGQKS